MLPKHQNCKGPVTISSSYPSSKHEQFTNYSAHKKFVVGMALRMARKLLIKQTFIYWQQQLIKKLEEQEKNERADALQSRYIMRRAFAQWQAWLKYKLDRSQSLNDADQWYKQKVKKKAIASWKIYVEYQIQKKQALAETVVEFRKHIAKGILRRSFKAWLQLHKDQCLKQILRAKAFMYFRKKTQRKYFKALRAHMVAVTQRNVRRKGLIILLLLTICDKLQLNLLLADYLNKKRLILFHKWKQNYTIAYSQRQQFTKADNFFKDSLLERFMKQWKIYIQQKKQRASMKIEALSRRRQLLLRRGLSKWFQYAIESGFKKPVSHTEETPIPPSKDAITFENEDILLNVPRERPAPRRPFDLLITDIRARIQDSLENNNTEHSANRLTHPPFVINQFNKIPASEPTPFHSVIPIEPDRTKQTRLLIEIAQIEELLSKYEIWRQNFIQDREEAQKFKQKLDALIQLDPNISAPQVEMRTEYHRMQQRHKWLTENMQKFLNFRANELPLILQRLQFKQQELDSI